MTEADFRPFVGMPCWFDGPVFEVRKRSDATLKAVENGEVVLAHWLGHETRVSVSQIVSIRRKDLQTASR
jgi:hypothetical protein